MKKPTGIAVLLTDNGDISDGCIRLDLKTREAAEEVFNFAHKYGIYITSFATYFEEGEQVYDDE